jgi:hypothetical protein
LPPADRGDTFVVRKLDRLAGSLPDGRDILDELQEARHTLDVHTGSTSTLGLRGRFALGIGFDSKICSLTTASSRARAAHGPPLACPRFSAGATRRHD